MKLATRIALLASLVEITTLALHAQPLGTPQFRGMKSEFAVFTYTLSDDGHVLGRSAGPSAFPMGWSPDTGYYMLEALIPGGVGVVYEEASANGKLVGTAETSLGGVRVPVVWSSKDKPPVPLAGFPEDWDCLHVTSNADATVIAVFMREPVAFLYAVGIWRQNDRKNLGWEFITQFPPGTYYAVIHDLSDDGTVGVGGSVGFGLSSFQGIRWSVSKGIEPLGDFPGAAVESGLQSCSWNGAIAVGIGRPSNGKYTAAVWTQPTSWVSAGYSSPEDKGSAFVGVDKDGRTAIGRSDFGNLLGERVPVMWNARDGMREVQDILVNDYGLMEAAGWIMDDVFEISANGRFITGNGVNPQGKWETWWAEIKPFCYADCDNSTSPKGFNAWSPILDIDDFICFQTKYAMGDYLYADCDLNGVLEIDDFICFQTKFAAGCP